MTLPIKINDLPAWDGDTAMCLHVSNDVQSQKLTVSDIASFGGVGSGLITGDIVLRPTGVYPGLLKADGGVYDVDEHVGLFEALANRLDSKYQVYDVEYFKRFLLEGFDTSQSIVGACFFGDLIAAVSADGTAGVFNLNGGLMCSTVNIGAGVGLSDKFGSVFATQNGVYFRNATIGTLYSLDKRINEIVLVANAPTLNRDYVPISISLTEDLFLNVSGPSLVTSIFNSDQVTFTQIDKYTSGLDMGSIYVPWKSNEVWTQKATGARDFCKIVDLVTTPRLSDQVVLNPVPGTGVIGYFGASDYIYFQIGVGGVNWKLDTVNNTIESVEGYRESSSYTKLTPYFNAATRIDTSIDDPNAVAQLLISYDFCETWQSLPSFSGSRVVSLGDKYALQAGKLSSAGAPDGAVGTVQISNLLLNNAQKFRVPNIVSNIAGFSYYIKG